MKRPKRYQKIQTGNQLNVWKKIQAKLYKDKGYVWLNFQGTRKDYTVPVIFYNVTPSGNVRVGEVYSTQSGGIPSGIKVRIAQYRNREGDEYLWIEDGTGSISCDLR